MEEKSNSALNFDARNVSLGKNYLLVGAEAYLSDSVQKQISGKLRQDQDIDISTLYADEVKSGDLIEYLDTFTIFSSSKLIVIKNCEKYLKKELEIIAAYFDAPSEIQTVVLITEKIDLKYNAWKTIKKNCEYVSCDPPRFAGDIRNWLMVELKRRGKVMAPSAIQEFTARIELDYFYAANELTKILLLIGDRKQISESDVITSLVGSRAGTQIDFFRALGNRNIKNALESVCLMLQGDAEPLQIFFSLYRFFMNLYKIQLLRAKRLTDTEIMQKHIAEIFFSQRKEYLAFAKNYSINALRQIFGILLETDADLKSSLTDKTLQLELCIVKALNTK